MLNNRVQVHTPEEYIAIISIIISSLFSVYSIGDIYVHGKITVFANQLMTFQLINIIMLFAEFYNNYFYSNFVAGIIVAFLEPTLIYGVALTNIRILKLYQKVDPDITDQLLKVANWLFSILYALPIIFLIIAYSLNINTLLKAGSYAILAFSVIVVIYNTAQGIYLISFVYNKNTSREKAKLVTEFRKATFIIVFMIMLDTAGIICFSIPQFIETDKNTGYLAVIIATSLTGIHYSSMQVMFKQISELSSQAQSKPPSAFSNWIGQLWKSKITEEEQVDDEFSQFQSIANGAL